MNRRLRASRLVAVAILGFLALNPPLLGLADGTARVLGIPGLYAYVFGVWVVFVGVVLLILRR
jgi:hypothetical protein